MRPFQVKCGYTILYVELGELALVLEWGKSVDMLTLTHLEVKKHWYMIHLPPRLQEDRKQPKKNSKSHIISCEYIRVTVQHQSLLMVAQITSVTENSWGKLRTSDASSAIFRNSMRASSSCNFPPKEQQLRENVWGLKRVKTQMRGINPRQPPGMYKTL